MIRAIFLLLWMMVVGLNGVAFAASSSDCLDPEAVRSVSGHFSFRRLDPQEKLDTCDPKNHSRAIIEAILFLKSLPDMSEATNVFDYGVLSPNPFEFFTGRINQIVLETKTSSETCSSLVMAYVPFNSREMHVCPYFYESDLLTRASFLVHEARHHDGYPHKTCQRGAVASVAVDACDDSYEEHGSYGVQTEFLVKMSRAQTSASVVRQEARALAFYFFMERFNQLPLGMKTGAVLVDDAGSAGFYDGRKSTSLTSQAGRWMLVGNSLQALDGKKMSDSDDGAHWGVDSQSYDESLRDVYSSETTVCFLYAERLNCESLSGVRSFSFGGGVIAENFASHVGDLPVTENAIYISTTTDDVYYLPLTAGGDFVLPPGAVLPKSRDFSGVSSFGRLDSSHLILLDKSGHVRLAPLSNQIRAGTQKTPAPGLDPAQRYQTLLAPYYWSPMLKDL